MQNGGRGEVISLPEKLGIFGNTHLMMQYNNSALSAGLILDWPAANVETDASGAQVGIEVGQSRVTSPVECS